MERLDPTVAHLPSAVADCAEATRRAGVQERAPAPAPGRFAAWRERAQASVWLPVAGKLLGILVLMSGLGGIGAASTLAEAGQLPIDLKVMSSFVELDSKPRAAPSAKALSAVPAPPSATAPAGTADAGAPRSPALTADGKVILNLATVEDLRHLPGIGPKRAEQIVATREKLKRFRRLTDLRRVKGIGPKRFQQIAPKLVLDPPPAASDAGAP